MEWYQWVSFLGVPSVVSILAWFYGLIRKQNKQNNALKLGLQAMLEAK